jgi:catalase
MNDETKRPFLTHASGAPVTDNVNIQTAGPRGPALLGVCLPISEKFFAVVYRVMS